MTIDFTERDPFSEYMQAQQDKRRVGISPSSVTGCYRRHAFNYLGFDKEREDTDAADFGTMLDLGWASIISSRYDPSIRRPHVYVEIPGLPNGGTADDVDFADRVVSDVKTTSDRAFQAWLNSGGPYDDYWDQVEVYAYGLWLVHGGDWTLRIIAWNVEKRVKHSFERPADPERGKALVEKAAARHRALVKAQQGVLEGDDPADVVQLFPREGMGPGRGYPCDWCPFVTSCWPEPDGQDGTPQSATVDPADEAAVAVFAADYLAAVAAESKARKQKQDALVFLAGMDMAVPDRDDPDNYEVWVRMVGGNPKDPVLDCEAMAEKLEELGLAPIVKDGGLTARYPKVSRRKRKAAR